MRTVIICLLLIGGGIALFNCTYKAPTQSEVVVLHDVTDSLLSKPQSAEIVSLLDLSGNAKWNGVTIRYVSISDVSYNKSNELKLEPANSWLSNEIDREKQIRHFGKSIEDIITANATTQIGRGNSSVYASLVYELDKLNNQKAENKTLIVYSDLMENTPDLTFYDNKTLRLLQSNDNSVTSHLSMIQTLPRLNNIQVRLIYQPANIQADQKFRIVSAFYKKLLEERGAAVSISANLD